MNNLKIRTQIAECEVAYYKTQHTDPVLAEVDMEFYHSLSPVQALLGEMKELKSLVMELEANNNKPLLIPLILRLQPDRNQKFIQKSTQ